MQKALGRCDTAAGRAHQVALLNQIRLNNVLDCAFFFTDRRGPRRPNQPARRRIARQLRPSGADP